MTRDIIDAVEQYVNTIKEFNKKCLTSQLYYSYMLVHNSPLYKELLLNSPRYKSSGNKHDIIYNFSREVKDWILQYCVISDGKIVYIHGENENKLKQYLIERIKHAYHAEKIRET
jgi:hypothetical protein